LYCIIYMAIICLGLAECKKEEEPSIKITNLQRIEQMFERDTLKIEYITSGSGLDSVCLIIDDKIKETQKNPHENFLYIPDEEGSFGIQLKLGAYYKSGVVKFSEIYYVNISNLITPPLSFSITRYDGLTSYFVGEKLSITVSAIMGDLTEFTQIKLFMNQDDLGTKTESPFTFITNEILTSENTINVELKDTNNRIHYVKQELIVPVNTPPENINYFFYYQGNNGPGAFLATDSILTMFIGFDNMMIEHVDFFIDDYKVTSFLSKDQSVSKVVNFGVLPAGSHSTYCIAYDDRGASTKSAVLPFNIYLGFELDDEILDVEYSGNEEMVFLSSKSKLYVINPVKGELAESIDLPYTDATSIDYVPEENNLYIAFNQGKLFSWNCSSQVFSEIALTNIQGIQDIEIDSDHNAVMASNRVLLFYNFSTGKRSTGAVTLDDGATLVFDKSEKIIVSGGNPHSSGSYIYEHKLISDSLHYVRRQSNSDFSEKLQIDPLNNKFLISFKGGYTPGITTYDLVSFAVNGVCSIMYPVYSTYSSDGNFIFIGDEIDEMISVFDAKSNSLIITYKIPVGESTRIDKIVPNISNSSLTVFQKDVFSTKGKVIFISLK
jgi:hypothetical protein